MKQQLNMADVLRKAQQQVDSVIRMACDIEASRRLN